MGILEHCVDILPEPPFGECCLLLIEHLVFESDADVLQDIQRNEALSRAVAASVGNDVLGGGLPARVCSVQSKISQGHAEPLNDCLVVYRLRVLVILWAHKTKQLVSELDDVRILGGQLSFKIFVQLLVQSLRPNEVPLDRSLRLTTA